MKRFFFILLASAIFFQACEQSAQPAGESEPLDSLSGQEGGPNGDEVSGQVEASFVCSTISEDDDMFPLVVVKALINGKEYLVDTVHAAEPYAPGDFASNQVPENALAAAGGWFAGSGDYFYMVHDGQHVVLMAGWQDEQQEGNDFHYIEKSRYPLQ